jgi:hypothetical protein
LRSHFKSSLVLERVVHKYVFSNPRPC